MNIPSNTEIIHIATHGFYDDWLFDDNEMDEDETDAVMKSAYLAMAGINGDDDESNCKVTADEISRMDLNGCSLVVLSSCVSGQGSVASDGLYGLQRGFKNAGVKAILMTLRPVDDEVTMYLMTKFYEYYVNTHTLQESLLNAQYDLLNSNFSSKDDWSAFVLLDATQMNSNEILKRIKKQEINIANHSAVDLHLSAKWSTCNFEANTPEASGEYLAWGELHPSKHKLGYIYKASKAYNMTNNKLRSAGMIDHANNLTSKYDAVTKKWGKEWRIPTISEFTELVVRCVWVWSKLNGVNGWTIIGPNGNYIFLPAAGHKDAKHLYNDKTWGLYWTSTHTTDDHYIHCLEIGSDCIIYKKEMSRYGKTIRPVTQK